MTTTTLPAIAELRRRFPWVAYNLEPKPGQKKPAKVPKSPHGGNASSTDPTTWGTFEQADRARQQKKHSGAGFVFAPLFGIDLDHCRDPQTGAIAPWAQAIIDRVPTYWEISPSGTGVHGVAYGRLPDGGRRKDGIELYDVGRYFTHTGQQLEGTPDTLQWCHEIIGELHAELFPTPTTPPAPRPPAATVVDLSDAELIRRAGAAANGAKFTALWNGDLRDYADADHPEGNHSSADMGLCDRLKFWANGDAARMDALFRQSALMRSKWDEKHGGKTYGQATIERALSDFSGGYTGTLTPTSPTITVETPASSAGSPCADRVAALEAENEALRRRVAELEAVVAAQQVITAAANERANGSEAERLRKRQRLDRQIFERRDLRTVAPTAIGLADVLAASQSHGTTSDGGIPVDRRSIAARYSVPLQSVSRHLKELITRGAIREKLRRNYDPESRTWQTETVVYPVQPVTTPEAFLEAVLALPEPVTRVDFETGAILEPKRRGGKREPLPRPLCPVDPDNPEHALDLYCPIDGVLKWPDSHFDHYGPLGTDPSGSPPRRGGQSPESHFENQTQRRNRLVRLGVSQPIPCDGCHGPALWQDVFGAKWCDGCAPPEAESLMGAYAAVGGAR